MTIDDNGIAHYNITPAGKKILKEWGIIKEDLRGENDE